MEFFGPGVANMDMSARATIANMSVDMGFTACIFPSDEITRADLARNGREQVWREIRTGRDPEWDEITEINLAEIEPMVPAPQTRITSSAPPSWRTSRSSRSSSVLLQRQLSGLHDCSPHCRREDAPPRRELRDQYRQPPDPGQRLAAGGIQALIEAGARVHEPGCLGCIGMGQAPATGTVSLRTFPRNFKGRSGTKDDHVYLCSPETAAASALTGHISDPARWAPLCASKSPSGSSSARTG